MRQITLPCGCKHELERERWTHLCPTHEAEANEIHDRWNKEHREVRDARNAG
jgi:hypothetical protein